LDAVNDAAHVVPRLQCLFAGYKRFQKRLGEHRRLLPLTVNLPAFGFVGLRVRDAVPQLLQRLHRRIGTSTLFERLKPTRLQNRRQLPGDPSFFELFALVPPHLGQYFIADKIQITL